MKVLYLTNIPSPYKVNFFNELAKKCDLTVIYERESASDRDKNWKAEMANGYEIIFLKGRLIGTDSSISLGAINYIKNKIFDAIIFGVYHTMTAMITMQYLQLKKIPFVLSSDGGFVKEDNVIKYNLKKHFISMASLYLSPGGKTNKYLEHYGAQPDKIYWYPFTSIYEKDILKKKISNTDKQMLRKKLGLKEENILLSVGQMIPRKGHDILIKAMRYVRGNVGLYIIGGNPTDEYLNLIRNAHLENVHFVDFKNKEELYEYYKASDLFVLATREDIWGLVVLETLGAGLPVVTTERCNSGLQLIQNGKNGYIVKCEKPEDIGEAINNILPNDLFNECIKSVEEYTFENMVQQHIKILSEMKGEP